MEIPKRYACWMVSCAPRLRSKSRRCDLHIIIIIIIIIIVVVVVMIDHANHADTLITIPGGPYCRPPRNWWWRVRVDTHHQDSL